MKLAQRYALYSIKKEIMDRYEGKEYVSIDNSAFTVRPFI